LLDIPDVANPAPMMVRVAPPLNELVTAVVVGAAENDLAVD